MLKGFILLYGSFDVLKFISLKMVQSKEPANLAKKWDRTLGPKHFKSQNEFNEMFVPVFTDSPWCLQVKVKCVTN